MAILIDESEMVDDDDQPFTTPAAVLAYLKDDFVDVEVELVPQMKVIGPGPAADEAFNSLAGLQG